MEIKSAVKKIFTENDVYLHMQMTGRCATFSEIKYSYRYSQYAPIIHQNDAESYYESNQYSYIEIKSAVKKIFTKNT